MHMKRASVAAVMVGLSNAVEERAADSPAFVEHVFLGEYTSTVFLTSTSTVAACGPDVTNCPASQGGVVTSIAPAYITVCPYTSTSVETPSGAGNGPAATVTHQDTATVTATPASAISSSDSSVSESSNTAAAGSKSASSKSRPSASSLTGVTANPVGTTGPDTTTTIKSTKLVTLVTTVTMPGGSSIIVPLPASGPPSEAAYTVNTANTAASVSPNSGSVPFTFHTPTFLPASATSTNTVDAVGATGTGYLTPTNGTLSTQFVPPTSTLVPFEGSAEGIQGSMAGLLIAAAAFFI